VQEPTGRTKRVMAVGLFSKEQRTPVEIFGVELGSNILHRFDERAPPGTRPSNNSICGAPTGANQPTTSKGTAGQVWVTVKQRRHHFVALPCRPPRGLVRLARFGS